MRETFDSAETQVASVDTCECSEIVRGLLREFPVDLAWGMELGAVRMLAAPQISKLILHTQGYTQGGSRRHFHAIQAIHDIIRHGYASPRGRQVLAAIRCVHAQHRIPPSMLVYALAGFVDGSCEWIRRFGWRRLSPDEEAAIATFWSRIGHQMGLETPHTRSTWLDFQVKFEQKYFRPDASNNEIANSILAMFQSRYRHILRPLSRTVFLTVLAPHARQCMGLPTPAMALQHSTLAGLWARKAIMKLWPATRRFEFWRRAESLASRPSPTPPQAA